VTNEPTDRHYTRDHEWILPTANGRARIGVTDFAQKQLGDIVFVETPTVGITLEAGEPLGNVESVKSVSEIYAPVAGSVAAVNERLGEEPELLNEDAYGEGWIAELTLTDPKHLTDLLTAEQYRAWIEQESSD
jgi:glycine cleavage system H protein